MNMHFLWFRKDKHADDGSERVSLRHDPAFDDFVALAYGDKPLPKSMKRYHIPALRQEHKQPAASNIDRIKLLPMVPRLDPASEQLNEANKLRKPFVAPELDKGTSLEEFYDQKDLLKKFPEKDEQRALHSPWAYKYRPAIEAFKNFSTMQYEMQCGVGAFGGKIAFFDPEVKYKHKEKDFNPAFLSHMIDGVRLGASEFDRAYKLEAAKPQALPAGLSAQQTEIYMAARERARQLESVIGPMNTLLQQPIKADMNDPKFLTLAQQLSDYYKLTKDARFYHTSGEDPISAARDQYFDTNLQFTREMNERKNSLWASPEIDKIHFQVSTMDRYRTLGNLLSSVQGHCQFLGTYEKQDRDQVEWRKAQVKEEIGQIKTMLADDCLRRDLSDPRLAEQHGIIERCQRRATKMMPAMLHMEELLDAGARKGKVFDASVKVEDFADAGNSPFWDISTEEGKLNGKRQAAIDEQVRKATPPTEE